MKSKISRNILDSALAHCYDACEKKSLESIVKFVFSNNKAILSCKGSFTYYEQEIPLISCDSDCTFFIKTNTILEFVKHVSTEELILGYEESKNSCIVSSSDKKSKIMFPCIASEVEIGQNNTYTVNFTIQNPNDFINKFMNSSKFCSYNTQDHPLTGIHLKINENKMEIKATNGISFYESFVDKESTGECEVYLPKKSPQIVKNIFTDNALKKCSINNISVLFESDNCKLKIYLEKCEKDSFPTQIVEWSKKTSNIKIKVSSGTLLNTLKFFNGVFNDSRIRMVIKDGTLSIESAEDNVAAKETVTTEICQGEATSSYTTKSFIDCMESLQASWVNLEFINMKEDFYICKFTNDSTLTLLCPTIS